MARKSKRVQRGRRTQRRKSSAPNTPRCAECGGADVIPVVHGPITPALQRSIQEGRAIPADREEWEGMTTWYCKTCGCDWGPHSRRFKRPGSINATRSDR
jgi:hypothetical protein